MLSTLFITGLALALALALYTDRSRASWGDIDYSREPSLDDWATVLYETADPVEIVRHDPDSRLIQVELSDGRRYQTFHASRETTSTLLDRIDDLVPVRYWRFAGEPPASIARLCAKCEKFSNSPTKTFHSESFQGLSTDEPPEKRTEVRNKLRVERERRVDGFDAKSLATLVF